MRNKKISFDLKNDYHISISLDTNALTFRHNHKAPTYECYNAADSKQGCYVYTLDINGYWHLTSTQTATSSALQQTIHDRGSFYSVMKNVINCPLT